MTNTQLRLMEIRARLEAQPGQPDFDPAYMYKNPHADAKFLTDALEKALGALVQTEQDTRNTSVLGCAGCTCNECSMSNARAQEAIQSIEEMAR